MGDVTAASFEVVLQYMYSDAVERLPEQFLSASAAEELFDAADRLLLFPMKASMCIAHVEKSLLLPCMCMALIQYSYQLCLGQHIACSDGPKYAADYQL